VLVGEALHCGASLGFTVGVSAVAPEVRATVLIARSQSDTPTGTKESIGCSTVPLSGSDLEKGKCSAAGSTCTQRSIRGVRPVP
jgi:hypothetical protein